MSEENSTSNEINAAEVQPQKKMRPCPHCKEMILKGAKKCPHCHGKIKPLWRRILGLVVLGLIIFGIYNSTKNTKEMNDFKKNLKEIKTTAVSMCHYSGSAENVLKMARQIKKLSDIKVTDEQFKKANANDKKVIEQLMDINIKADSMIQYIQAGNADMAIQTAAKIADGIKIKK